MMPSFLDSVKGALSGGGGSDGNVTSAIAGSNMKVASSVFETGANDALTVVDQFGKRAISVINQQVGGLKGKFDSFLSATKVFGLTKSVLSSISQAANSALKAVKDAKARIEGYTGLNLSSLGAAKASLKNAAITTLSNVTGVNVSKVIHDGEDILRIAKGADVSSVNGLFNSVNQLLRNDLFNEVVDLQTESAIFGGLLTEAAESGVLKLFDTLWDKVKGADDQCGGSTAVYSAANALPQVIRNGDLEMMEKLVASLGGTAVKDQYPNVFQDVLQHYRLDDGKDVSDYPAIRAQIVALFDSIDPHWSTESGNGGDVYCLDAFLNASRDVQAIFQLDCIPIDGVASATATGDPIGVASLVGLRYRQQYATPLLRAYYPNIPYA